MTLDEAADYARRSRETLRRAAVEFQRSDGRTGLRGFQRKAGACWRFTDRDVDRWIKGLPPERKAHAPQS